MAISLKDEKELILSDGRAKLINKGKILAELPEEVFARQFSGIYTKVLPPGLRWISRDRHAVLFEQRPTMRLVDMGELVDIATPWIVLSMGFDRLFRELLHFSIHMQHGSLTSASDWLGVSFLEYNEAALIETSSRLRHNTDGLGVAMSTVSDAFWELPLTLKENYVPLCTTIQDVLAVDLRAEIQFQRRIKTLDSIIRLNPEQTWPFLLKLFGVTDED